MTELIHQLSAPSSQDPLLPQLEKHAAHTLLKELGSDRESVASRLGITKKRLGEILDD